jgi:hypothetical protein
MKVVLRDTLTTYWRGKMQYDHGQCLEIYNAGIYDNNVMFQFIQNGIQHDVLGELINHEYYSVKIPDDFLKNEDEIKCFLYWDNGERGETKKIIIIDVLDREWYSAKPTEKEISLMGQLIDKVNELQESLENFVLSDEQREAIVSQVIEEAKKELNFDNYYTKEEVDNIKQDIWYPTVDELGNLTWEKSLTDIAPAPANIKGEKGEKGDKGETGEAGKDGKDGQNGLDGKDGQDGKDYVLTEDDKLEIENNLKNYVDTYILGGEF